MPRTTTEPLPRAPSREYIVAGGVRVARIQSGATVYYHRDQVSTRVTTDANGNVLSQQGHYPFGESWYQSGATPNSAPPNPPTTDQQFTTYLHDSESGNDYAPAREFVNRLGRFSSLDPLAGNTANPQSLNRYTYAANDPIDLLDPEGEYILCDLTFEQDIISYDGGNTWQPNGPWSLYGGSCSGFGGDLDPLASISSNGNNSSGGGGNILSQLGLTPPPGPPNPLALCASALFGVTMTSFSPSVPGQPGTFTGVMGGVFTGVGQPPAPGPSQIAITNDNMTNSTAVLTVMYAAATHQIVPPGPGGQPPVEGLTYPSNPFTNYSGSNLPISEMQDTQIWELGNSLGYITGKQVPTTLNVQPGPQNNEPGNTLLNCVGGGKG